MRFERTFQLGVPPELFWPLIANTDSLNRELFLPAVQYETKAPEPGKTQILARTRVMGQALEWIEHPFEWITPREYHVERDFTKGPIVRFKGGVTLKPTHDGTQSELFCYTDVEPRGLMGQVAARVGAGQQLEKFGRVVQGFEQYLKKNANTAFPQRSALVKVNDAMLSVACDRAIQQGADEGIVQKIAEHFHIATDEDVLRMRAFTLAKKFGTDPMQTLRSCLHCVKAGLLEMTWDVLCPGCRGVKEEKKTLRDLRKAAHCSTCEIRFDADFDRSVEVRFSVPGSIRTAQHEEYCIGGPINTPHVLLQQRIPVRGEREVKVTLRPGHYLARVLHSGEPIDFFVEEGATETLLKVEASPTGAAFAHSPVSPLRAGEVTIHFHNPNELERTVRIEQAEWTREAASAALVTSLQDFRDLFSSEFLAAGEELSVRSLTFLFTDLKGSTALYEEVGDAQAYVMVREHFALLTRHIRECNGAIVKTIGDAVMATFMQPEDAVRCVIAFQQEVAEKAKCDPKWKHLIVKAGLHQGPCIAVTSNERLDFFGGTVNLSARVQSESQGADLTYTDAVAEVEKLSGLLARSGAKIIDSEVEVKGFSKKIRIHRATW